MKEETTSEPLISHEFKLHFTLTLTSNLDLYSYPGCGSALLALLGENGDRVPTLIEKISRDPYFPPPEGIGPISGLRQKISGGNGGCALLFFFFFFRVGGESSHGLVWEKS